MRRIILIVCILAAGMQISAAASPSLIIGEFATHGDILMGFVPTMVEAGALVPTAEVVQGSPLKTGFIMGGGYSQRMIWKNADGSPGGMDEFNVWSARWNLFLRQGFIRRGPDDADTVTVSAGIRGRWEKYTGNEDTVFTTDNLAVFPDAGDTVSNELTAAVSVNLMERNGIIPKGVFGICSVNWAPPFLLNTLLGTTDYLLLTGEVRGYYPIMQRTGSGGLNIFSVYLANRMRVDTFFKYGSDIPVFPQIYTSLGTKMRSLEPLSYGTSFTAVNNFDLRFAGPELGPPGLYPMLILFTDLGYSGGTYANTSLAENSIFLSAGIDAVISLFDFIHAGYRFSSMIFGDTMIETGVTGGIVIGIQFL